MRGPKAALLHCSRGFFQSCFSHPVQGTTVESICFELRYLNGTRGLAKDHTLLLLCDLSHSNPDAVDVAIVSFEGPKKTNSQYFGLQSEFVTAVEKNIDFWLSWAKTCFFPKL